MKNNPFLIPPVWAIPVVLFLGLAACEDGSYFDPSTKQMKSDAVSRLEATGEDLRVYEFTPRSAPEMKCVFVAGNSKGGLQCVPAVKQKIIVE